MDASDSTSQLGVGGPPVVEPLCTDVCRLSNGQDGYALCHLPDGNPDNPQDLCIANPAIVNGHMENHEGDYCGPCEVPVEPCGDGTCDDTEDCETCPSDCGECEEPSCEETQTCPPTCGDQSCDEGENCYSCPADCGECPVEECENPDFCGASLLCCDGYTCSEESVCVPLECSGTDCVVPL